MSELAGRFRETDVAAAGDAAISLQMNSPSLELSIIIPAFNEERRLPRSLERIHAYVTERSLRAEVIVVDDGSSDSTAKLVETSGERYPELRLVSNGRNRGKGYSVRHGMLEARGDIALFTDADLSAPIEEADKLLAALCQDHWDGAIGSRAVDRSLIETPSIGVARSGGHHFQSSGSLDCRPSFRRYAVWFQSLPPRTRADHL